MSERQERCETCRWWDQSETDGTACPCKRYPPVLTASQFPSMSEEDRERGIWPYTESFDWCGEWQRIPLPLVEPAPPEPEVLARQAWTLDLSVRVLHAFEMAHPFDYPAYTGPIYPYPGGRIKTIGQLIALTADDLLERRRFGNASLLEVRTKLAALGLKLKDD